MRKAIVLFISLCYTHAFSQSVRSPVSAGYIGTGAYSTNHVDVFSCTDNQAALSQIKNISLGFYGEKRFLLDGLNMLSAIVAMPTASGNFALQMDYFGFSNYNESQIGVAYARSVGKKFDVGAKFNYYSIRIPAYRKASTVDFEIGGIAHITDKLNIGIHASNPVGGNFSGGDNEKLSSIYKLGIGYDASESFFVTAELIKEEDQQLNINAGFQYNFIKRFFVRAGLATELNSYYAGAGITWENIRLDVNASYHYPLGLTPGLMLIVNFKEKGK